LIVLAYLVGAVLNHGLFAALHEVTHNLVFKTPFMNKVLGLGLNLPQLFPASAAFRHYHLIHHSNFSEYDYDADIAHHWEARLIQNSPWRKAIWYSLFLVVEALRPLRLKNTIFDRWVVANVILIVVADVLIWQFLGFKAFCYLGLSTIFGLGLHPVGARWIQEHYLFDLDPKQTTPPAQETFSYYGALNLLSYNVGYHVEHHDFFRVPWIHLPKLKKIAPEYYLGLKSYRSWTLLLWRFLFDRNVNLFSRVVR
jgi:sphingolipid delta-4 desaturase